MPDIRDRRPLVSRLDASRAIQSVTVVTAAQEEQGTVPEATTTTTTHQYPLRERSPRAGAMLSAAPRGSKQPPSRSSDRTSKRRKLAVTPPPAAGVPTNGVLVPVQQAASGGAAAMRCPKCGGGSMIAGMRCRRCLGGNGGPPAVILAPGGNGHKETVMGRRHIKAHRKSAQPRGGMARQQGLAVCTALGIDGTAGGLAPVGAGLEYESPHVSPASALAPEDLRRHVLALKTESILRAMRPILTKLMTHPTNKGTFNQKVDVVALKIPEYYNIIKNPMDLGTIKGRLQSLFYMDMSSFANDVRQVFANARLFNPKGHWVHEAAKALEEEFEQDYEKVVTKAEKTVRKSSEHRCSLCKGQECALCGEKCIRLEPPVLMCQGQCAQRIKRGGVYYISSDGSRIFCQRCHSGLPPALIPTHPEDETDEEEDEEEDEDEEVEQQQQEEEEEEQQQPPPQQEEEEEEDDDDDDDTPMLVVDDDDDVPSLEVAAKPEEEHQPPPPTSSKPARTEEAPVPMVVESSRSKEQNGALAPPPGPLLKRDLLKRRFDDEIVEPWVKCNGCDKWLHQICALYNPSNPSRGREWPGGSPAPVGVTKPPSSTTPPRFYCPLCKLRSHSRATILGGASTAAAAVAAASTKLMEHGDMVVAPPVPVIPSSSSAEAPRPPPMSSSSTVASEPMPAQPPPHEVPPTSSIGGSSGPSPVIIPPSVSPTSSISAGTVASSSSSSLSDESSMASGEPGGPRGLWCAESLPETHMSRFIQGMVRGLLRSLGEEGAASTVSVRVVSSIQRQFDVHKTVRSCFSLKGDQELMRTMSYKSKGILLFQKIDGLDICLFSMYVQEYDKDACEPNRRRVYIAYLDSVEYFRPRTARTKVYHEILVSYLLWSQLRGFRAAHIWACPPQRGNNFIFWCHPQHQKTPSKDRLLEWYRAMLERARELGAVQKVTNLYQEYFRSITTALGGQPQPPPIPPTSSLARTLSESTFTRLPSPPLFEGDFWVEETIRLHFILRRRASMEAQLSSTTGTQTPGHLCHTMLKTLMSHPSAFPFNVPVDPEVHKAPRYFEIVKRPMDLTTALRKLRSAEYSTLLEVKEDVDLVFENAMTYNPPLHAVHRMAVELRTVFHREFGKVVAQCLGRPAESSAASLVLTGGRERSASSSSSSSSSSNKATVPQQPQPAETTTAKAEAGSTTGAGLMNKLAQLEQPLWDNALLSRISVTESLAVVAATLGERQQAEQQHVKQEGQGAGLVFPLPQPPQSSSSQQLPSVPLPSAPLEHESSQASCSTLSCCTSVSGRSAFIAPRQIVTELIRSVDKMKEDLLVLHLQPADDEQQQQEGGTTSAADMMDVSSDGSTLAKELMAAARASIAFGDTSDPDDAMSNSLVDSRHTFLEMCQFRHYQFDTLRRAKYSSAMVLYHLLDPTSPALRVMCTSCMSTIPAGSLRWHCGTCSSMDLCEGCFEQKGGSAHQHPMTPYRVTFSSPTVDQSSSSCP